MANAKKCDRCERCFDPFNENGIMCKFRNPLFQTSNDIQEGKIGRKLMVNDPPDAYIDLCPECAEMFEAFMCGAEPPAKPVGDTDGDGPMSRLWKDIFGEAMFDLGKTVNKVTKELEEREND